MATTLQTLVRHEGQVPRERSTCGWRDRLISREDSDVAAWVHAVDIDGAREHYHKMGRNSITCSKVTVRLFWTASCSQ